MIEVGLIGCGGIARDLVESINHLQNPNVMHVVTCLARSHGAPHGAPYGADDAHPGFDGILVTSALSAFLERRPGIVAEVASQSAVQEYGAAVLRHGIDLMVVSTGALANAAVYDTLKQAAIEGHARLMIPAGAIGGLDVVGALRLGGLKRVVYRSVKPPRAWKGTKAEQFADLDNLTAPCVFYRGSARAAALAFPQNANVAATIALAGVGFDDTDVELIADPDRKTNEHQIQVEGHVGRASLVIESQPSRSNPKTSALTALSVFRALVNESEAVVI